MLSHVTFTSSAFPEEPSESEFLNAGRYGQRLCNYLQAALTDQGLAFREPQPEDWGWCLSLDGEMAPLWIGVGNVDDEPDGFLCFIEPSRTKIRSFPKFWETKDVSPLVSSLQTRIDGILNTNADITNISWTSGR